MMTTSSLSFVRAWSFVRIGRLAVLGAMLASVSACVSGPIGPQVPAYVVFFTPFSADLDDSARTIVTEAAQAARTTPGRKVLVAGYADRIGTAEANQTLTKLRAQVVADGLVAAGVDRSRIVLQPKGSVGNEPGIESRRVAIEFP